MLQAVAHVLLRLPHTPAAVPHQRMIETVFMFLPAGGLTEAVLLQLGKLPRIKAQEGMASDVDTDKDVGSEATDLGEGSDMDIY
jgi:hypothetical protein